MDSDKLATRAEDQLRAQAAHLPTPSVPYSYVPLAPQEPSLADYWRVLLKRKWSILATAAVVLTLATLVTFRTTPQYDAVGRIAIFRENTELLNFKDFGATSSDDWDYTIALETQVKILQSDSLALQVLRNIEAKSASGTIPLGTQPAAASEKEAEQLAQFRSSLRIATIPNTRMIEVRYLDPDPRRAAQIINTLAATYTEQNFKTKYESTMQASEWLRQQLADLQIKVETSQEKLVKYQKEKEILGIDEKQNITTQKLDELNRELTNAQADRIQKEAAYRQGLGGKPELSPGLPSGLLDKLRSQEADLRNRLAQLSAQFGPAYPTVVEVSNQLKETQAAIAAESGKLGERAEREYLTALSRERMLRSALETQKQEANLLNERAIQYNILKRDVDSNRQLYEGLLQKLKEAGVSAGLKSSNVRVVDAARVPIAPAKPDIPRNLALALLLGLSGGVALAFILEMMDNTVRTPEQVQYVSALPSLGIIPMGAKALTDRQRAASHRLALTAAASGRREAVELVAYARPKSEIAESYRALRTSILLSSLGAPPKIILVTSALPQEGKTTTSINTAIVLAQKGARVLLVDADLRRPSIHHKLGMKSHAGLSTVLAGSDPFESAVLPSPQLPNLFVLPAGPPPPHPAELLGSSLMKSYLARWREEFDHVIIDTPPALSVTDAVLLSVEVDSVILVIRSGQTTKEALRRARDLLVQVNAKVMGVVVNAVDLQSPDLHYYYYGSKYGGHYYEDSTRN